MATKNSQMSYPYARSFTHFLSFFSRLRLIFPRPIPFLSFFFIKKGKKKEEKLVKSEKKNTGR